MSSWFNPAAERIDENPQKANQRFSCKYGYVRSTVSDFPASREIDYLV